MVKASTSEVITSISGGMLMLKYGSTPPDISARSMPAFAGMSFGNRDTLVA